MSHQFEGTVLGSGAGLEAHQGLELVVKGALEHHVVGAGPKLVEAASDVCLRYLTQNKIGMLKGAERYD